MPRPPCRQAKLDSLSLLGACAASYGPRPLAPHASTIWAGLRAELAAPSAEGLLPADLPTADDTAAAATACLARCVAAFQEGRGGDDGAAGVEVAAAGGAAGAAADLAEAVLGDPSMHDMLACIRAPGAAGAAFRRSALRARAGSRGAAALCLAGGAAGGAALAQLLPPLLAALRGGQAAAGESGSAASLPTQCLGWAAVLELLEAAGTAPGQAARHASEANAALLQRSVSMAAAALAAQAAASGAGSEDDEEDEEEEGEAEAAPKAARWPLAPADCTSQQAATQQLGVLAAAFGAGHLAATLERQQVEAAAAGAVQLLTVSGVQSQRQQAAAVAALTALAGGAHATVLTESALPRLVAAAGQRQSAGVALAALQALAAANSSLQLQIVAALDNAIEQLLPAAAAEGGVEAGAPGKGSAELLVQLLQAAARIVAAAPAAQPAGSPDAATSAAAAAEAALQLGQHLFDATQLLPPAAASTASPDLQDGCAQLACQAMRAAAAAQQQRLAAAAAAALQQPQGLQTCVACALLVPLHADAVAVLPGGSLAALVQQLVTLALAQQQETPLARWAAAAAAALLNKWPARALRLAEVVAVVAVLLLLVRAVAAMLPLSSLRSHALEQRACLLAAAPCLKS